MTTASQEEDWSIRVWLRLVGFAFIKPIVRKIKLRGGKDEIYSLSFDLLENIEDDEDDDNVPDKENNEVDLNFIKYLD